MNNNINRINNTTPAKVDSNVLVLPDADAQLIANASNIGRIVGKTSVRVTRVVGVFVISAFKSAKEEYDRIKQCK